MASYPAPPSRRLSWAEQQARREKGLCFNCDEQFVKGHTCKTPQALLMEACREEENPPLIYDEYHDNEVPTVPLNALLGETGEKSMRMKGQIGRESNQLLVDSGAILNFINPQRAEELRLPVTNIPPLLVRVANGDRMPCQSRFDSVPITIQGIKFCLTLYGLNVCNLDVVLGLPWLESLGRTHGLHPAHDGIQERRTTPVAPRNDAHLTNAGYHHTGSLERMENGGVHICAYERQSLEEEDVTWESVDDIRQRFPELELGDKFSLPGEADDERRKYQEA